LQEKGRGSNQPWQVRCGLPVKLCLPIHFLLTEVQLNLSESETDSRKMAKRRRKLPTAQPSPVSTKKSHYELKSMKFEDKGSAERSQSKPKEVEFEDGVSSRRSQSKPVEFEEEFKRLPQEVLLELKSTETSVNFMPGKVSV
jgi:hypothetical protein